MRLFGILQLGWSYQNFGVNRIRLKMVLVRVPKRFSLKNHSKKHQPPYVYVLVELGEENDGEVNFLCFAVGSSKRYSLPREEDKESWISLPHPPHFAVPCSSTHPPRERKERIRKREGVEVQTNTERKKGESRFRVVRTPSFSIA